jgi:sporulation protein YlmC with PRC-barrel domain
MDKKRDVKKTIWIVTGLLLFSVAVPLYAASQKWNKQSSNKEKMQKQQQSARMTATQYPLFSAKKLIGSKVRSWASVPSGTDHKMGSMGSMGNKTTTKTAMKAKAEKIGTVKEIIFDNAHNWVDCVIVASQGKFYPVPWWAFNFRERYIQPAVSKNYVENPAVNFRYNVGLPQTEIRTVGVRSKVEVPALYLNITKEQLAQAPTINSISLERISNPALRQKINSFYSQHAGMSRGRWEAGNTNTEMKSAKNSTAQGTMKEQTWSQRTPGSPVAVTTADLARATKVIGLKVRDTRYDDVHQVQNVLIDVHGGRLAFGLVNFGGFLGIDRKTAAVPWSALTINVPEGYAKLDASRSTLEAAVIKKGYMQRLAERQYARQIYNDFGTEPYWQVFGFVPGEETTMSANPWLSHSTYNKCFDSSKVTTVEGTIESVSSFYPVSGSTPGTCLNVKTKDGTSVTIYAGPQHFTMQQNLDLKSGSKISVTGSRTMVNGKSVIIASELQVGGKSIKLRDQNGKPEWTNNWSQQHQK